MSPTLHFFNAGFLSTVQDLGRIGGQRLGIPTGGALDPVALQAANLLVGNPPATGALECFYVGPTFRVEAVSIRLAFAGASVRIDVCNADGALQFRANMQQSFVAKLGQKICVGSTGRGSVFYMAVEGGFDIAPVMGSMSTFIRGQIGGWHGRALKIGDILPINRDKVEPRQELLLNALNVSIPKTLRIMFGPQDDYFSSEALNIFSMSEYTVGIGADRMGFSLEGAALAHTQGFNITSDAIAPGSIQVPGNGHPIVLRVDRQTTGGYPKIATVISADLPALGRISAGDKIRFLPVNFVAAVQARAELMSMIADLPYNLIKMANLDDISEKLFGTNLISGVVSAFRPGETCAAIGGCSLAEPPDD